jgi:hypothetical protein
MRNSFCIHLRRHRFACLPLLTYTPFPGKHVHYTHIKIERNNDVTSRALRTLRRYTRTVIVNKQYPAYVIVVYCITMCIKNICEINVTYACCYL